MSISLKVGQNVLEHPRYQVIKTYNLSKFGLNIGDIVKINQYSYENGGTLYRVTGENPPYLDAVWGVKTCKVYKRSYASQVNHHQTHERMGWLDKQGKLLSPSQVIGTVEFTPIFTFMSNNKLKKKNLRYDSLKYKVKKIDIITLGKSFASYKEFIDSEIKRLQSDTLSLDTWCW
jgi:hypothetical protein